MRRHARTLSFCRRLHSGHPAAFVSAAPACRCALLAMLGLMLSAFLAASIANVGARLANSRGKFTATRHVCRSHSANLCAIHVELNAARHFLDILFRQAGNGAVIAGSCAGIAFVDTGLKLFMCHEVLLGQYLVSGQAITE